ncbi:unnamed protein product [Dibothriocephalus latus]|uniref:Uncharacterized protein n=1 Tax=Dibothriocephalus latus TaxID=60516 RepID=A0A3P7LI89_DIBLA|nr:unnamed protein product [Dibothriocephalus latus]
MLRSDWMNTFMYFTRLCTVVSCICFILAPLIASLGAAGPAVWYQRALIANAATSALRLRQRIMQSGGQIRFSMESVRTLLAEDSLHYLIFSMLFVMLPPVTVALVPVFCFALLHSASFTENLLRVRSVFLVDADLTGSRSSEIMLMGVTIFMAFSGPNSLFLPFLYFQFLKLRYASRRNPFCRQTFYELRILLQQFAANSSCPAFLSRFIYRFIDFLSKLSPPVASG